MSAYIRAINALSNMAPSALLQEKFDALELYAKALSSYTAEIDDIAQRMLPASRTIYRQALAYAEKIIANPPAPPASGIGGATFAEIVFKVLGQLDEFRHNLDIGTMAALNPLFLEGATRRMSQTFSNGIEMKAARLRAARNETTNEALLLAWAKPISDIPTSTVAEIFHRSSHSHSVASLYAAVLEIWLARGVDIVALVEDAKDASLGLKFDTPAAIRRDIEAHADLHPLQAMGITFGLIPELVESDEVKISDSSNKAFNASKAFNAKRFNLSKTFAANAVDANETAKKSDAANANKIAKKSDVKFQAEESIVTIDISLPQAKKTIRYNLPPLIDVRAAIKFGALATVNSGLSFHLMRRLQTIIELEKRTGGVPAITVKSEGTQIVRTSDHGATFEILVPPGKLASKAYTTIGAGPRPRIERLGELLEEAVFMKHSIDGIRVFTDPEKLVDRFNKQVDLLAPDYTLDELSRALEFWFLDDCNKNQPITSAEDLLDAIMGQRGSRNLYRTYIAKAIVAVSKQGMERQLLRDQMRGDRTAALFGSSNINGGRREILLTQATGLRAMIGSIRQKLLAAFLQLDGDRRAREFFTKKTGVEGPAIEATLRARISSLYQNIVKEAFNPTNHARKKDDSALTRLSLKLYILEHGTSLAEM